jgi:hypothetical protein
MASLESLPADQRAVLQLVLQRGRSYDEIADLLSIDRAAVRQRALQALDAIGPQSRVPPERRALITDYLLGQLPPRVSEDTRARLAESASERAWARVIAAELSPLASKPLPEIPVEGAREEPRPTPAAREATPARQAEREPEPAVAAPEFAPRERAPREPGPLGARPSSRRGGAILLGLLALGVIAAIVIVIASSGGSSNHNSSSTVASTPSTATTAPTTTSTTSTATSTPRQIAQVNLTSPHAGSQTVGVAAVFRSGTAIGVLIQAQKVPPNTKHDAYAVWLYNSPSDSKILGFVSPGVGSNGRLSTAGRLPNNAGHYKQLLVTRETQRNPSQPGTIILQGQLTGLS